MKERWTLPVLLAGALLWCSSFACAVAAIFYIMTSL